MIASFRVHLLRLQPYSSSQVGHSHPPPSQSGRKSVQSAGTQSSGGLETIPSGLSVSDRLAIWRHFCYLFATPRLHARSLAPPSSPVNILGCCDARCCIACEPQQSSAFCNTSKFLSPQSLDAQDRTASDGLSVAEAPASSTAATLRTPFASTPEIAAAAAVGLQRCVISCCVLCVSRGPPMGVVVVGVV